MPNINRDSVDDAEKVVDSFISDETIKYSVLSFLSNAIVYANDLEPHNWNLNLDKDGKFVRFNVGQEYCIEMYPRYTSVLALKEYVPKELVKNRLIEFKGYHGKKKILSFNLEETPDCLVKIHGSVGCHVRYERNIAQVLPLLKEANLKFIEKAIVHTEIHPLMIHAHSPAFIDYLSQQCNKKVFNPAYVNEDMFTDSFSNPLEEIENYSSSYEGLQETERQAVIQSRIGQGKFRADLVEYWGECAVTGCQKMEILRASHIKPWSKANNQERLDVYNGLLLVPNLDSAFDAGYISFTDNGHILISRFLNQGDQCKLGIHSELCICRLDKKHFRYLQYHREYKFKDG